MFVFQMRVLNLVIELGFVMQWGSSMLERLTVGNRLFVGETRFACKFSE